MKEENIRNFLLPLKMCGIKRRILDVIIKRKILSRYKNLVYISYISIPEMKQKYLLRCKKCSQNIVELDRTFIKNHSIKDSLRKIKEKINQHQCCESQYEVRCESCNRVLIRETLDLTTKEDMDEIFEGIVPLCDACTKCVTLLDKDVVIHSFPNKGENINIFKKSLLCDACTKCVTSLDKKEKTNE
jgi:hypothetical protein